MACALLLCIAPAKAQKYTFTHYDIENGLIQSQVNRVYQDTTHRLWLATLGGVSRFDGVEHYALSKATGLKNNFIYSVFCDKQGTVWIGANKGLAYFKNEQIHQIAIPEGTKTGWINHLTQDAAGTIWGTMENHLFKVSGNRMQFVNPTGKPDTVSTVAVNKDGKLFVGVNACSIYSLNGNTWQTYLTFPKEIGPLYAMKLLFDRKQADKLYIQAYRGLFVAEQGKVIPYEDALLKSAYRPFVSFEQDADNNLWIGTMKGAYRIAEGKLTYFNSQNGLSDAEVSDIYKDRDNNLWFGTQGDGLYRYNNDGYVTFNQYNTGESTPIVMGIAKADEQDILLAIDGGGLARYNGKTITNVSGPMGTMWPSKVLSVYKDATGLVWIGTSRDGIWQYNGHQMTPVKGTEYTTGLTITGDTDGTIWAGISSGVYYFDQNRVMHATQGNTFTSSLLKLGGDSLLLGTHEGIKLMVNKKLVSQFSLKELGTTAIYCMIAYKGLIIIGTDDSGIFVWDRHSNKVKNFTTKNGLAANSIYSLATDEHGTVWSGTGRGVSRFTLEGTDLDLKIIPGSDAKDRIIESNQNAILYNNHQILIGTTKGLSVYSTALPGNDGTVPFIMIDDIRLFEDNDAKPTALPLTDQLIKLSADQNHLSISFLGVYLRSPAQVTYQYRLIGLNNQFCAPVKNNVVDYPSLPPGKYTFEVRAIAGNKQLSKNKATFSFEIAPPFYQRWWFQLATIALLVLSGVLIQHNLHQRKLNRLQAIEDMRQEEKMKIRQQTAEDFHDDLGNKLTRITVLSDILNAKLEVDKTEHRKLVGQIKQNAASLYNGTRDILWAMDPKSDNLYEVLNHIRETGIEIFADTNIDFKFDGIQMELATVKLPMEYSRNITMIFKELLNNALKHAHPHHVQVTMAHYDADTVILRITDDGAGFDQSVPNRGHGLVNMQTRAKRIGGQLSMLSTPGKGTSVDLTFNINNKQPNA